MLQDLSTANSVQLVLPASCANSGAATSGWVSVAAAKGAILVVVTTGAITGTLDGKMQRASDSSGTNAADIAGAAITQITAANQTQTLTFPATAGPYIKFVGTVGTGPVVAAVNAIYSTGQAG